MPDQQPKKRRKRNAPKIARKLRNKHSRPSLPSAPPDDVANDPALADNEPSPPEDDLPSPILIAPSKPSKDQIIDDLKKQKKSAQNRGYYLEKVVEKKDVTIDDQKEKVKSLVKNEIRLSLLEAAAQARAAELKANAEKLAATLDARTSRYSNYRERKEDELKRTKKKAKDKIAKLEEDKIKEVGAIKTSSERAYQKLHVSYIFSYVLRLIGAISLTYLNYHVILFFCRKII